MKTCHDCNATHLSHCKQGNLHAGCTGKHARKSVEAYAQCRLVRILVVLVVLAVCILWAAGCSKVRPLPTPRPAVAFGPVVTAQEGKDSTVLFEAAQIDALAPDAKPHTDAQRAAVAAAPAAQVSTLVKQYEDTIDTLTKGNALTVADLQRIIAKLTQERDEARNQTDRTIIIGGYALAALLTAAGVATFFLMAQLAFLGPRIGVALIAGGGSVFGMLQAYQWTKAHPWVTGITLLCLAVAAALALSNQLHYKSEK